jgi:hypothetical protein
MPNDLSFPLAMKDQKRNKKGGRTLINKSKIYELFGKIRQASTKGSTMVIAPKHGILKAVPLSTEQCDAIEKEFLETKRILGSSICEISEIFTIGKAIFEFDHPRADEVREAVIRHFEHQNSIIFQVKDPDGYVSLYYYKRNEIGEPAEIRANHKTIYFETGRCFHTQYLAGIIPVSEALLN